MASTSKAFKKCVDPCPRYLTPDDTHNLCVFCLGKDPASSSASRDPGPTAAEAQRRMKLWGSQLDLADELERDRPFSRASAENESELLDCDDAIFLTSSDSAASALLGYAQEE